MAKKNIDTNELQNLGAERQRERGYAGDVDFTPCGEHLQKRQHAAAKVDAARAAAVDCAGKLADAEKTVAAQQEVYDKSAELADFTKLESDKVVQRFRSDVSAKAEATLAKAETALTEATDALNTAIDARILDNALAKIDPAARHAFETRIIQSKLGHFTALADLQGEIATRYQDERANHIEATRLAQLIDPSKSPVATVGVGDAIHARLAFLRDVLTLQPHLAPVPAEYRLVAVDASDPNQAYGHRVEVEGVAMVVIDHANLPRVRQERREALEKREAADREEARKKELVAPVGVRLRQIDEMFQQSANAYVERVENVFRMKHHQSDARYLENASVAGRAARSWFASDSPLARESRRLRAQVANIWEGIPIKEEPPGETPDQALARLTIGDPVKPRVAGLPQNAGGLTVGPDGTQFSN